MINNKMSINKCTYETYLAMDNVTINNDIIMFLTRKKQHLLRPKPYLHSKTL
jgi:hypothetical protein